MINSILIKGFRGISNLKIDGFKKINLFIGKNNCGKTSILEALFLVTGISNPQLSFNINRFRNLIQTEGDDFRFIFNKLDFKTDLRIEAYLSPHEHRILKIQPNFSLTSSVDNTQKIKQNEKETSSTISPSELVNGLIFNFTIKKSRSSKPKEFRSEIQLDHGTFSSKIPKNYNETISGVFVSPSTIHGDLSKRLEKLIVNKQKDSLIRTLQLIDENIRDISLGNNEMIYLDLGYKRLVPVNIVGDGIRRLLSFIAAINYLKDGIVFIDEIENGLHFSSLKVLWQSIIESAKQNNAQLFITTHSKETLDNLKNVLNSEKFQKYQKEVKSFTIRKHDEKKIVPYAYDFDKFEYSIEKEIEMR